MLSIFASATPSPSSRVQGCWIRGLGIEGVRVVMVTGKGLKGKGINRTRQTDWHEHAFLVQWERTLSKRAGMLKARAFLISHSRKVGSCHHAVTIYLRGHTIKGCT